MPQDQGLIPNRSQTAVLTKMNLAVQRQISSDLLSIDIGNFSEFNAVRIQQKDMKLVDALTKFTVKWAKKALRESYESAARIAETRLQILGADLDPFYNTDEPESSINSAINATVSDFFKANESIKNSIAIYIYLAGKASRALQQIQAFDLRDEEVISELLDDALKAGASREVAGGLILDHFAQRMGGGQLININGRNYKLTNYAKLVARTRLRTIQSEAVKNMASRYGNDLIEISDHGSEFDDICLDYEGNVYSISGDTPGYEKLPAWPPFHIQCSADRNSRVLTDKGLVPICKIKKGDMVFTHKGRFKPVVNTMKNKFKGQTIWINGLWLTYNHRMFTESGLIPAGNLTGNDELFEVSSEYMSASNISLNSNYFPAQRRNLSIPLSILFNLRIMISSINFKVNFSNGKIKNIFVNYLFLNKINVKFFKDSYRKLREFGLIFKEIFSHSYVHFLSNFRIRRRVVVNHPDFVFPEGFGSDISNASFFNSSGKPSLDIEMIKKFNVTMRRKGAISKHFTNITHSQPLFIKTFYDFFKRIIKPGLNRFNLVKKLLPLSTGERAGLGIKPFVKVSTDHTSVHNAAFVSSNVKNHTPIMLPYTGEVYNIEVEGDHSYVLEGFLVKNCQHSAFSTSEVAISFRGNH